MEFMLSHKKKIYIHKLNSTAYVAIGQKVSSVAQAVTTVQERGATKYTLW